MYKLNDDAIFCEIEKLFLKFQLKKRNKLYNYEIFSEILIFLTFQLENKLNMFA